MELNIGIDMQHPVNEVPGVKQDVSPDCPQVCLPQDWETWKSKIEESLRMHSLLQVRFSSTANTQTIAIIICEDNPGEDAFDLLMEGDRGFGFIVDKSTLRELRGAIDAAMALIG